MHAVSLSIGIALVALFAGASPTHGVGPEREYLTYTDPQYHFTFQYPSEWTRDDTPKPGSGGETRVVVRDPQSPARSIISIGKVDTVFSKTQFESSPDKDRIVESMIDLAVKQIYQRTAQEMQATKMMVGSKQPMPSIGGIKFYISTAQVIAGDTVVIAGTHIIPFDQPYMVTFMMISPFKISSADQGIINKVFNSFRLLSEPPRPQPKPKLPSTPK